MSVAHSRTLTTSCVSLAARTPSALCVPVVRIATSEIWVELERHCLIEDDRIAIEHHRERHRNLEGDYGTRVAALVARATHTHCSLGVTGGCMPLAPHLRMVVLPRKFCLTYQRSMMGSSTPLSSCRSTTPLSSLQGGMRLSWPTTSPWP
jgi:hypothetical protein